VADEEEIVAEEPSAPGTATEPEATEAGKFEFDLAFQRKIAALAVADSIFVQRTDGLIDPAHFESEGIAAIIKVVADYTRTYKSAPGAATLPMLLKDAFAAKKIRSDIKTLVIDEAKQLLRLDLSGRDFVIDKVAEFARKQAIYNAILTSAALLEKGDYDKIGSLIRNAVDVGAADDYGEYDYWAEITSRTDQRLAKIAGTLKPTGVTTGYADLDKYLYHRGWGRKELTALMGAAKRGKSMGLGEFALAASKSGLNAIYFTCEVGTNILGDRFDANVSDTEMKALGTTPHGVKGKIEAIAAKAGALKIFEFPSGMLKVSQIRRILERYRAKGMIFDLIAVDYADILAPERRNEDPREDSRLIWIDLRGIAFEQNAAVLTATQTNREGANALVAKDTTVAEDYNKVRTADLMISINASEAEIAAGEARLFFAAARNDEGNLTLRIKQDRKRMKFITTVVGPV